MRMKDQSNDSSVDPRMDPATEARIVALVLGEASDFEEADLNKLVEKWPEMRLLRTRLEAVNELLEEVAASPCDDWKLSGGLREKLLSAMEFCGESFGKFSVSR